MLLQKGMEQITNVAALEYDGTRVLGSVSLRAGRESGDLYIGDIVANRYLDDVFDTGLDVGCNRRAQINQQCQQCTCRGTYGTDCARVPCVEATGVKDTQRFRYLFARVEKLRIEG